MSTITSKEINDSVNVSKSASPIQYPSDLQTADGNKYIVHFSIISNKQGRSTGGKSQKIENPKSDNKKTKDEGTKTTLVTKDAPNRKRRDIYLYMPENITDTYSHDWDTVELGSIKRLTDLADMTLSGQGGEAASQAWQQLKKVLPSAMEGVTGLNANSLLERNTGVIVNPNIELLYKGTQLKQHNFQFKFIPKNAKESLAAKQIIEMFKYYSAPSFATGDIGSILLYPEIFTIDFIYSGSTTNQSEFKDGWMHTIYPCALTSIEVNYTGSGQFASMKDGSLAHIEATLQFQELTIQTKDKIKNSNTISEVRNLLI